MLDRTRCSADPVVRQTPLFGRPRCSAECLLEPDCRLELFLKPPLLEPESMLEPESLLEPESVLETGGLDNGMVPKLSGTHAAEAK